MQTAVTEVRNNKTRENTQCHLCNNWKQTHIMQDLPARSQHIPLYRVRSNPGTSSLRPHCAALTKRAFSITGGITSIVKVFTSDLGAVRSLSPVQQGCRRRLPHVNLPPLPWKGLRKRHRELLSFPAPAGRSRLFSTHFYRVCSFRCSHRGREVVEVCVEAALSRKETETSMREVDS